MWSLIQFLVLSLGTAWSNEPIVISGAGPASLMFAHRFLRANDQCKIVIYEKRDRPLRYSQIEKCIAGDYAFGFGLSKKAQGVLRKIPNLLESVEAISQLTEFAPGVSLRLVNRREFCAELLHALEAEFGSSGRLTIHFKQCISNVDPCKNEVEVSDTTKPDSIPKRVPYSLLIGADGANSVIRSKLINWGDILCERYFSDVTWKALQLPEQPNVDASTFFRYPKKFYKPHRSIKRDNGAILPRFQNQFVLLNFRSIKNRDDSPFDAKTPQDLKDAIQRILPNITKFPPDQVLESFLEQKPGRESFMKLDKHGIEKRSIALIGDASNGMYSLLGQGCASALMQADMLAGVLTDEEDLATALSKYSEWSIKEGHAIADLNLLQHSLRQALPIKIYAGLQMMKIAKTLSNHPEIPYSEIYKRRKRAVWVSRLFWRRARQPAPNRNSG